MQSADANEERRYANGQPGRENRNEEGNLERRNTLYLNEIIKERVIICVEEVLKSASIRMNIFLGKGANGTLRMS